MAIEFSHYGLTAEGSEQGKDTYFRPVSIILHNCPIDLTRGGAFSRRSGVALVQMLSMVVYIVIMLTHFN